MHVRSVSVVALVGLLLARGCATASSHAAAPAATGTVVFASARDGNYEIYSMRADGSHQTRLTETAGPDEDPAISPDGSAIAYLHDVTDDVAQLWVMHPDGT